MENSDQVNACERSGAASSAQKWSDRQSEMQTPTGCVRIGGEDRFPKIPFFFDSSLIDQNGNFC
jgi:hypothetical protein